MGTAKGLVRGHLRLLEPHVGANNENTWVDCLDQMEPRGHSISPISAHLLRAETMARTILVVEKETVFQRLLAEGLLDRLRPLVLVTARGYPDFPTRYLLRRVHEDCARPRIMMLVDYDPSGLLIAATYAFGSHKPWAQDDVTLPEALPIICPGGVEGAAKFGLAASDVLPLSKRDRSVAVGLLKRLERLSLIEEQSVGASEGKLSRRKALETFTSATREILEGGVKYEIDAFDQLLKFTEHSIQLDRKTLSGSTS